MLSTFHPVQVKEGRSKGVSEEAQKGHEPERDGKLTSESLPQVLEGTLDSLEVTLESSLSPSDVTFGGLDSNEELQERRNAGGREEGSMVSCLRCRSSRMMLRES